MTYEEILQRATINHRRSPRDEEHRLQCSCVSWFNSQYPKLKDLLYAVPNGGRRDKVTASKLKQEGVVAGVSDLNLDLRTDKYGGLRIEMKTPTGRQSESQKQWQKKVTEIGGYKYVVCRSLDDFICIIINYLEDVRLD